MKKKIGFFLLTCLLVFIAAFSVAGVAQCQSMEALAEEEAYLNGLEEAYVTALRAYLEQAGYRNSGVMLTRTVFEDGSRECRIEIHNRRFDRLSEEQQQMLVQELSALAFSADQCSFCFSLTGTSSAGNA